MARLEAEINRLSDYVVSLAAIEAYLRNAAAGHSEPLEAVHAETQSVPDGAFVVVHTVRSPRSPGRAAVHVQEMGAR